MGRDLGRDWRTLADAVRGTGWKVELVTRAMQVENIDLPAEIRHRHSLPRDQYLQLLADATIVVVPTHVRAYPSGQTVLLEAMALGKPCVVTDTPAMREYATDEVTALVVPPHDPPAVKRTIQRLLDEPLLRARLGSQAKSTEAEYGGAGVMWVEIARCVTSADASECAVNPPLPDTDQARPANTDR
ncbi:MAG: glycosyltransferase [Ilumatobacter sp.]|uniref:glycosyltransferase n=1 Tax=Ilumatobacter sp. TaxID=1967498 RepID=UPI00329782BD